jgi:CRP/FNR family transcriptional regulator
LALAQNLAAAVRDVIPQSFLRAISPELALGLLEGGRLLTLKSGTAVPQKPRAPGVAIVVEGLVRVYLVSPQRRQVTVRYARPGETLGLVHLYGGKVDVSVQAVTATVLHTIPARRLRAAADQSAPLATAIAKECAALVADAVDELALLTFGSVRQLVARHLLDLATTDSRTHRLVANVTQQGLADATGSVREVVARVLKDLDRARVTARGASGVTILNAAKLDQEARGVFIPPEKKRHLRAKL